MGSCLTWFNLWHAVLLLLYANVIIWSFFCHYILWLYSIIVSTVSSEAYFRNLSKLTDIGIKSRSLAVPQTKDNVSFNYAFQCGFCCFNFAVFLNISKYSAPLHLHFNLKHDRTCDLPVAKRPSLDHYSKFSKLSQNKLYNLIQYVWTLEWLYLQRYLAYGN